MLNKTQVLVISAIAAVSVTAACTSRSSANTDGAAADLVAQRTMSTSPSAQAQNIVTATNAFLATLNAEQRSKVQFPFTPEVAPSSASFKGGMGGRMDFIGERYGQAVWSNYPVSDVPRPGVALGTLSVTQRESAMGLLQVLLSANGYQKILDIMGSDQALSAGGTNFSSGRAFYTIGIFGAPSVTLPWMVEFGGHHLGLNVVIAGARGSLTPTLTGAQNRLSIRSRERRCECSHRKTTRALRSSTHSMTRSASRRFSTIASVISSSARVIRAKRFFLKD